ncbi:hypothetical protein Athai_07940 [Actinocatenispora thailandica]|uniref:Uncharacterized protein n=1 Tax=Actinocatenispora thailandica TaxID=227318 RepID=A0A7R7HV85_9ACTN|nr:hypothetical protein Athai_07940 [Actinocatenispora thailandica]
MPDQRGQEPRDGGVGIAERGVTERGERGAQPVGGGGQQRAGHRGEVVLGRQVDGRRIRERGHQLVHPRVAGTDPLGQRLGRCAGLAGHDAFGQRVRRLGEQVAHHLHGQPVGGQPAVEPARLVERRLGPPAGEDPLGAGRPARLDDRRLAPFHRGQRLGHGPPQRHRICLHADLPATWIRCRSARRAPTGTDVPAGEGAGRLPAAGEGPSGAARPDDPVGRPPTPDQIAQLQMCEQVTLA